MIKKDYVVQFKEHHKWCGCLGIVTEVNAGRIMVGVPIPEKGTAFVFCKEEDLELVGASYFILRDEVKE